MSQWWNGVLLGPYGPEDEPILRAKRELEENILKFQRKVVFIECYTDDDPDQLMKDWILVNDQWEEA